MFVIYIQNKTYNMSLNKLSDIFLKTSQTVSECVELNTYLQSIDIGQDVRVTQCLHALEGSLG